MAEDNSTMQRIITAAAATVAAAALAAPAQASTASVNHHLRAKVVKLHGKRAPGCDLVAGKCRHVKPTKARVRTYFATLRRIIHPPPPRSVPVAASVTSGGTAYQAPTATTASTPATAPTGGGGGGSPIPQYIVDCESGGDYNARNPSGAYGKYQIMPGTAAAYGCSLATPAGQDQCAARIYAKEGAAPWACG